MYDQFQPVRVHARKPRHQPASDLRTAHRTVGEDLPGRLEKPFLIEPVQPATTPGEPIQAGLQRRAQPAEVLRRAEVLGAAEKGAAYDGPVVQQVAEVLLPESADPGSQAQVGRVGLLPLQRHEVLDDLPGRAGSPPGEKLPPQRATSSSVLP